MRGGANRTLERVKSVSITVYGFAALLTACIYFLSTLFLPLAFNTSQMHMNVRNGILVFVSVIILFVSGIALATIIYLIGTGAESHGAVKLDKLFEYIKKNIKGVIFFVLSSFIWSVICGLIALAIYAGLKNAVTYESVKIVISAVTSLLTFFVAPLILIETICMMLKDGGVKERLKYGLEQCRTGYMKALRTILLLLLIGLVISVLGAILKSSIFGKIIMFIIWSMFGGYSLTKLTMCIQELLRGRESNIEG